MKFENVLVLTTRCSIVNSTLGLYTSIRTRLRILQRRHGLLHIDIRATGRRITQVAGANVTYAPPGIHLMSANPWRRLTMDSDILERSCKSLVEQRTRKQRSRRRPSISMLATRFSHCETTKRQSPDTRKNNQTTRENTVRIFTLFTKHSNQSERKEGTSSR